MENSKLKPLLGFRGEWGTVGRRQGLSGSGMSCLLSDLQISCCRPDSFPPACLRAGGSSGTHRCASSPVLSAGEAPSSPPSRAPASSGLLAPSPASPLACFHRLTMLSWLPPAGLLALFLVPVPRMLGELCVPDRVLWLRVRAGSVCVVGVGQAVCSHQTQGGLGGRWICFSSPPRVPLLG